MNLHDWIKLNLKLYSKKPNWNKFLKDTCARKINFFVQIFCFLLSWSAMNFHQKWGLEFLILTIVYMLYILDNGNLFWAIQPAEVAHWQT